MRRVGYRVDVLKRMSLNRDRYGIRRAVLLAGRPYVDPTGTAGVGDLVLAFAVRPDVSPYGPEPYVYLVSRPARRKFELPEIRSESTDDVQTEPLGKPSDPLHEIHPYLKLPVLGGDLFENATSSELLETPRGPTLLPHDAIDWLIEQVNAWDDGCFNLQLHMLDILTPYASGEELMIRYPRVADI